MTMTIEKTADLHLLPIGTRLKDADGDTFIKTDIDGYTDPSGLYGTDTAPIVSLPATVASIPSDTFSVGDKVLVETGSFPAIAKGSEGVVVSLEHGYVNVNVDSVGYRSFPFRKDELGLVPVTVEPTFKDGDRVVVKFARYAESTHGRVGTLKVLDRCELFDGTPHPYHVKFDNGDSVYAAEIAVAPGFNAGDIVIVPADARTVQGGGVYFYKEVKAKVIELFSYEDNALVESVESGMQQYVDRKYLTLATVSDTELIGATVHDTDALAALPEGTVVRFITQPGQVRQKTGDNWYAPGRTGTFNYGTQHHAAAGGLLVLHVPVAA